MTGFLLGLFIGAVVVLVAVDAGGLLWRRRRSDREGSSGSAPAPASRVSDRFQAAFDELPLGVVLVGGDGRELYRNPAVASLPGSRQGEVLLDETVISIARAARTRGVLAEELSLAGPPRRCFIVAAHPLPSGDITVTVEDVTESRRLDEVRTDFVANVSHELKTPVGAISVLAETLEGETADENLRRLARRMVLEAERMSRTIDDLLELSRIEMGGNIASQPVDAVEAATEAIERVQHLAARSGIEVSLVSGSAPAVVQGDRGRIVSAVVNLVENAVKYSESGSRVSVRVVNDLDGVVFEVEDTGIGIPPDAVDRIFERFYRVDRARSRDTGGTGLGLSIVRNIASSHGGDVRVESREGEGSTFRLRIPRTVPGTRR
jgi:two-component system sensor histidine kinase SenX3